MLITVSDGATLHQVRHTMTGNGVDAVLVVGRVNGSPLGWITATGLLAHLDDDPFATRAVDLISEQPNVIGPGEPLRNAATMLAAPGVTHLLVSGGRSFAGVLTARDLLHVALHDCGKPATVGGSLRMGERPARSMLRT